MTDSTEHHETRRKDPVIVERAQRWLKVNFSWGNIFLAIGAVIALAALFIFSGWIYSVSQGTPGLPGSAGGTPVWLSIVLIVLVGMVVLAILFTRARSSATATAGAGVGFGWRPPTWLITIVVVLLVVYFWGTIIALFPPGTQATLAAFGNALATNWVLAGLILAALLWLLSQKTAAIIMLGLTVLAFFLMPDAGGLNRAERFTQWITTPAPNLSHRATPQEQVWAHNTSRDCPGKMMGPYRLSTVEVKFNPNGCFFYALGSGEVKFSGLFFGDLTVDLRTGAGDSTAHSKVYAVRASYAPVTWQYILCSGPKKDMSTLDCR